MPAGVLTIRPGALPEIEEETVKDVALNTALTPIAFVIVTMQVSDVPLHAPPQPEKLASFELTAVNVTTEPRGNNAVQVAGHAIAPPPPITVPGPATDTASVPLRTPTTKCA
jgi:hypothetical protein